MEYGPGFLSSDRLVFTICHSVRSRHGTVICGRSSRKLRFRSKTTSGDPFDNDDTCFD
jgi:hypothetical protein